MVPRLKILISGVLIVLGAISTSIGQPSGSITLDHIESLRGDTVAVGHVSFFLRFTLQSTLAGDYLNTCSNSFVIYSPDGATWSSLQGTDLNSTMCAPYNRFINVRDANGTGRDSINYFICQLSHDNPCNWGVFPQNVDIDTLKLRIDITIPESAIGKTICLDSVSHFPPSLGWEWYYFNSNQYLYPTWGGPYCFTVADCCTGLRGNVNGMGSVTIQDVTYLIAYLFLNGPTPVCPSSGDTNGDGKVTNTDLTRLISFLFGNNPVVINCP